MSRSQRFLEAFGTQYAVARSMFSNVKWEALWTDHWNRFMLWNPLPPQQEPLLAMTAKQMGLMYWDREPFRLDAAFVTPDFREIGNIPLPLIAAIEHENDIRGFQQEIAKLAHVRCPLKVGITYSQLSVPPTDSEILSAKTKIDTWIEGVNKLICAKEDPSSEYVYLLGVETVRYTLEWHYCCRTADSYFGNEWMVLSVPSGERGDIFLQ
jgi:hypothetical protein